jgi:hypothetical protein
MQGRLLAFHAQGRRRRRRAHGRADRFGVIPSRQEKTRMSKKNDLLSTEQVAETLGVDEAEVAELLESGELRRVWNRAGNDSDAELKAYVLGSDVHRLKQQTDPRYMAKLAAGEVQEPDESGDTPRSLAESVPRF